MYPIAIVLLTLFSNPVWSADSFFEAPIQLTVDDVPINTKEKLLYPTPVLFDVDGDQQAELVIGDLWGHLHVYENQSKPGEAPRWKGPKKLQADGKDLKVSNW